MLRLENLNRTFLSASGNVAAVQDVSLSVPAGQVYGIIGASGAGKSTLVRCINLLERPDSGRVYVDGEDVTALPPAKLRVVRRSIGMIFQHFNLMASRTVLHNVTLPLVGAGMHRAEAEEKALSLLNLVSLTEKANSYPSQLSGGQKQRVAIARALSGDPKVLLCDEATSALDPQTTLSVLSLLKELNEKLGLTIVIITHEMAVIKEVCHRVAIMDDGRVVEEGAVYDIFSRPQHPVTRRFIDMTSPLNKMHRLIERGDPVVALKPGEQILRLRFRRESAAHAYVSEISRRFDVNLNIIFGDIEIIQDAPLGGLVVIASGEEKSLKDAVDFLRAKDVDTEVISRG